MALHRTIQFAFLFVATLIVTPTRLVAQKPAKPTEADYYRLVSFPLPEEVVLEASGLDWLDAERKRLAICTRRGEVWVLDNVYADAPALEGQQVEVVSEDGKKQQVEADPANVVRYTRMLFGLHEPLGLLVDPPKFPKGLYTAQRSELTRLVDENGDDRIDVVERFGGGWEISGSYHEYAFGPKLGKDGQLWITLNRPFGGGQEASAYWRGWAVKFDTTGKMTPVCPGLRSPAGLGKNCAGDMFFTDNQGDHVAVGKLGHLEPDGFHGQTEGLNSVELPESNFTTPEVKDWPIRGIPWREAMEKNPKLRAPAIWFPYPEMGRSQTDILCDDTGGKFGPFAGQTFVGDLSNALVMRCFLEKVDGEYQGAVFPFRSGFTPPVLRMTWGHDGSMFAGGSSRGWGGGKRPYGLQRLVWTGETPFEIHEMRAKADGFELTFTQPVDPETAGDPKSYGLKTWYYHYHSGYGDKPRGTKDLKITKATVAGDGKSVRLVVEGLETYWVHELRANGVRNEDGLSLLHPQAYYTLNRLPTGEAD